MHRKLNVLLLAPSCCVCVCACVLIGRLLVRECVCLFVLCVNAPIPYHKIKFSTPSQNRQDKIYTLFAASAFKGRAREISRTRPDSCNNAPSAASAKATCHSCKVCAHIMYVVCAHRMCVVCAHRMCVVNVTKCKMCANVKWKCVKYVQMHNMNVTCVSSLPYIDSK